VSEGSAREENRPGVVELGVRRVRRLGVCAGRRSRAALGGEPARDRHRDEQSQVCPAAVKLRFR